MAKEIEVKAKLENVEEIIKKLTQMGIVWHQTTTQEDRIYLPKPLLFSDDTKGIPGMRIRLENGSATFTTKKAQANDLSCIEYEISISDPSTLDKMLDMIGFHVAMVLKKTRQEGTLGNYTICIDHIDQLGNFLEVEYLSHDEDPNSIQKQLWQFCNTLGIHDDQQVADGYHKLMQRYLEKLGS